MFSQSQWIRSGKAAECPMFKKEFCLKKTVEKAALRITAAGVYEA